MELVLLGAKIEIAKVSGYPKEPNRKQYDVEEQQRRQDDLMPIQGFPFQIYFIRRQEGLAQPETHKKCVDRLYDVHAAHILFKFYGTAGECLGICHGIDSCAPLTGVQSRHASIWAAPCLALRLFRSCGAGHGAMP